MFLSSSSRLKTFGLAPMLFFALSCGFRPVDVDVSFGPGEPSSKSELALIEGVHPDHVGYMLYDLDRGAVIRAHNRDRGFIPASTAKVPTATAALEILGPDHRFRTIIGYAGTIQGGTLKGNLWLKGGGEPLLGVGDLMGMIDAIKKKGIRKVEGRFIYDESELAAVHRIDESMDQDMSYNTGVSALSLDYNTIVAEWKRERKSESTDIYLIPTLPMNRAGISPQKLRENVKFAFREDNGTESWLLSPEERGRGTERLPVKRPGLYTAQVFARLCAMRGVELPSPESGVMPARATSLAVHEGKRLIEIVDTTLAYSINLSSELIMMAAAKRISSDPRGAADSSRAVAGYLAGRMQSVEWNGLLLANGSGLTVRSRITPEQMTAFLVYADAQDYGGTRFRYLLPASGWSWSLARRLGRPDTAFHVWAKTGTINFAQGLAGYLHTSSGRNMAFVVFVNDIDERRRYDSDPDRRNNEWSKKVNVWHAMARDAMDGIVAGWIREL